MPTEFPRAARARPTSRMPRGGATAILLVVALLSVLGRAALLDDRPVPLVQTDELIYHEAAVDIADGRFPRMNDRYATKYPPLYPATLAPVRYFTTRETFPWWSRVANLVLLALALIPAYRLARYLYSREVAVPIAIIANVTAAQNYSLTLMSENLICPLFLWLTLATVRLAKRPSAGRAMCLGVVLALSILTKSLMLCVAPALLVALGFGTRRWLQTAVLGLVTGATAFAVIAPWWLRRHLFPSEADVPKMISYYAEAIANGFAPIARYVYWSRMGLGHLMQALGPLTAALAIAAVLSLWRERRVGGRTLALFITLCWIGFTLMTAIWTAQIEYYHPLPNERYLVFVFPVFLLIAPIGLFRARAIDLSVGAVVAAACVIALPAKMLTPSYGIQENPSHPLQVEVICGAVGPLATRLIYLATLLPLLLLRLRRRRAWGVALLLLVTGYQVAVTTFSYRKFGDTATHIKRQVAEFGDWLEPHLRPDDALVLKHPLGAMLYNVPEMLEIHAHTVGHDFEPRDHWSAKIGSKGQLEVDGATGRILLLAREFRVWALPVLAQHGPYRLYEANALPIRPLGSLHAHGVWADAWCDQKVVLHHPATSPLTVALELSNPPNRRRGPLHLTFRHGETIEKKTIPAGGRLRYEATIEPRDGRVGIEIEAFPGSWIHGRLVTFKLEQWALSAVDRAPGPDSEKAGSGRSPSEKR